MPNPYTAAELAAIQRDSDAMLDAVDRAIIEAGLIADQGPQHERRVVKGERLFQWHWYLVDTANQQWRVIATGTALTNASAWRKVERAYAAELGRIEAARLEAQAAEIRDRAPRASGGTDGLRL